MDGPDGFLWECSARLLEVFKACLKVDELEFRDI
jgi:hypothetical protein